MAQPTRHNNSVMDDLLDCEEIEKEADIKLAAEDRNLGRVNSESTRTRLIKKWEKLNPDQLRRIYEVFHNIDADSSGFITPAELEAALVGIGFDKKYAEELFYTIDYNHSGAISYREFMLCELITNPNAHVNRLLTELQRNFRSETTEKDYDVSIQKQLAQVKLEAVEARLLEESHLYNQHISDEEVKSLIEQGINPMDVVKELETHDARDEILQQIFLAMAKEKVRRKARKLGRTDNLDLRSVTRCFAFFDVDENGSITRDEFAKSMQMLGLRMNTETVDAMFSQWDSNHDGELDYIEFTNFINSVQSHDSWVATHTGWKFKRAGKK